MVNILNIIEFLMSALSVQGIDLSFWYFDKISDFGKMCNVNDYC